MEKDQTPEPISFKGVMVSSTFTDLEEHRAALIKAIKQHGFTDIAMENDSAKPDLGVIESSLQMIRDASAYVGVISHKYGQTPACPSRNQQQLSITELEFNEALRLERPILLFIMGEDHPTKKADVETDPIKLEKLNAFRQRAKLMGSKSSVHRVYATFQTLEQFKEQIHISLAKLYKHFDNQPNHEKSYAPIEVNLNTITTPSAKEINLKGPSVGERATSDNSVPNDEFVCKVRDKIKTILSTDKPAALALRKVLLKDQPQGFAPEDILIPKNNPISPEDSIRRLRTQVVDCLQQTNTHVAEIKQCASEIMGWLILLCVNGIHAVDFDKVNEIVVPYKKQAGIEVFVARLQQRPAALLLNGHDKVDSEGHIVLGDIELGFHPQDRLLEIKRSVYTQVFPGEQPDSNDDWVKKLRKTIQLRAEDDHKLYYFSLPIDRRLEFTETIKQLKACLPELQILITGTLEDGSQSIGIMAEGELEALILHFLTALAKFS